MDYTETLDELFADLFENLRKKTVTAHDKTSAEKYLKFLNKELKRVKLCVLELAYKESVSTDLILDSIIPKNMMLS